MNIRNILYRAGQNPAQSWRRFKIGVFVFVLGIATLTISDRFFAFLYWPAVGILLSGFVLSMRGYWGIFANRFARLLEQRVINQANDPFATSENKSSQD